MRAIVWTRYGPPEALQLREVPKPVPRKGEVQIRVLATSVTAGDCELRGLRFSVGLRIFMRLLMGVVAPRNRVLGQELSGTVESIGPDVTRFRPGDPVFGTTGFRFGAYAEYVCLPTRSAGGALASKPTNLTFEEAAVVPTGGLEALHFLGRAGPLAGRRVLINGAGGGIGRFAVQLAKQSGAEVTGVDRTSKLELLRSLGADHIVDFTKEDFTTSRRRYDVIFDIAGGHSLGDDLSALTDDGSLLLGNPGLTAMVRGRWMSRSRGKKVVLGAARQRPEELDRLRELLEAGRIRPVIDRTFPLESMAEAHRYFETGTARGSVAIRV